MTTAAKVSLGSTRAPTAGSSQIQGGSFSRRASLAYGKLETMAKARTATPPSRTVPGRGRSISTVTARTAAAIVVGTPQKNLPSLGETLKRARRIAAQPATRTQATAAAAVGTVCARDA